MWSCQRRGIQERQSQAVRIPKEFQLDADEVEIRRRGSALVLPKAKSWAPLVDSLTKFTDDFMADGRQQPEVQKRDRSVTLKLLESESGT